MGFWDSLASLNDAVNGFVWTTVGVWLLLATGILMTVLTKFFQVSHIGHWMKKTVGSLLDKKVTGHTGEKATISQFQALCTALAATVGVGNIAGVSAAILTGGPGAVFWMWMAAFFGMMTNYSENILGIYFRRKNHHGEWSGGAMYYLQDGLGGYRGMKKVGKVLAVIFAICAALASFGIGNMGQVNKIVMNFTSAFKINFLSDVVLYSSGETDVTLYMLIVGILIMILVGVVVIGGLQRIATVAEKIIPFMVVTYVIGALIIIFANIQHVGPAFGHIFSMAFSKQAAWGGATGVAFKTIITQGCKRGVFSNEAGLGSSVMVHSNSNVKEPVKQGLWGIFEVFADTIIVCTLTAFTALSSGLVDLETGHLVSAVYNGVELTKTNLISTAFAMQFGRIGSVFIAVSIMLFAFSTVLGWSHYGTKAAEYLVGEKRTFLYRILFVLLVFGGAVMGDNLAWDLADTFNGLMMIPNLIGVITLSGVVVRITKNYLDRQLRGLDVPPIYSAFPDVQAEQEKE